MSGYASNNALSGDLLPSLIRAVYQALSTAATTAALTVDQSHPPEEVKKSVFADRRVCLACGQSFQTLKRHLATGHQLTPGAYRERYGLPSSYPLVSPNYAKKRSGLAKKIGLSRKAGRQPAMKRAAGKRP